MAVEYLGNGKDDGTILGRSTTDLIGFYGNSTPIAKQTVTMTTSTTTGNLRIDVDQIHQLLIDLGLIAE